MQDQGEQGPSQTRVETAGGTPEELAWLQNLEKTTLQGIAGDAKSPENVRVEAAKILTERQAQEEEIMEGNPVDL